MDQELKDGLRDGQKIAVRVVLFILAVAALIFIIGTCTKTATKATHINDAVIVYEEFQEVFNTCKKLNTDLCNMADVPENDPMFLQFSKAQRVLTLKTQLNRWVETYNAKSKMWGRSLWKSKELPYTLNVNQFSCY